MNSFPNYEFIPNGGQDMSPLTAIGLPNGRRKPIANKSKRKRAQRRGREKRFRHCSFNISNLISGLTPKPMHI
jgi:hypothetical protein